MHLNDMIDKIITFAKNLLNFKKYEEESKDVIQKFEEESNDSKRYKKIVEEVNLLYMDKVNLFKELYVFYHKVKYIKFAKIEYERNNAVNIDGRIYKNEINQIEHDSYALIIFQTYGYEYKYKEKLDIAFNFNTKLNIFEINNYAYSFYHELTIEEFKDFISFLKNNDAI